ncbi:hypothetical protein ACPCVL_07480 [Streptomyces koyangensis]|uniref:hypothetical protein n=1 Tax=Streptomyces koyangensis TaxID=188770 RepID=UPI003C2C5E76
MTIPAVLSARCLMCSASLTSRRKNDLVIPADVVAQDARDERSGIARDGLELLGYRHVQVVRVHRTSHSSTT